MPVFNGLVRVASYDFRLWLRMIAKREPVQVDTLPRTNKEGGGG